VAVEVVESWGLILAVAQTPQVGWVMEHEPHSSEESLMIVVEAGKRQ
jgi:hypothetical protein